MKNVKLVQTLLQNALIEGEKRCEKAIESYCQDPHNYTPDEDGEIWRVSVNDEEVKELWAQVMEMSGFSKEDMPLSAFQNCFEYGWDRFYNENASDIMEDYKYIN